MEKYYTCYNANADFELNPVKTMLDTIKRTDSILKYLIQLQKDIAPKYVKALIKRLLKEVEDYTVEIEGNNLQSLDKELKNLKHDDHLTKLIIHYIAKTLVIPEKSVIKSEPTIFTNLTRAKAMEGFSYYRVKAFEDVLGKEEGIKLYTKILKLVVKESNKTLKINEKDTVKLRQERAVKRWCKEGVGDFIFTYINDDQVLYRFDRCVTHEALKDHNDPDIAYIASCFIGDIPEYNEVDIIHLRRTQTLHHGDFCDELYWDTRKHEEPPKQPSLDFTKNIASEVKEK